MEELLYAHIMKAHSAQTALYTHKISFSCTIVRRLFALLTSMLLESGVLSTHCVVLGTHYFSFHVSFYIASTFRFPFFVLLPIARSFIISVRK